MGVVLLAGVIPLLSGILSILTNYVTSRQGTASIASFSALSHAAGMLMVVSSAGTGIFIMACGMAFKKMSV